ncbi:MAG: aminopeptidase P family protein [Rhodothermia bacterium]|nr:aminopeptidase P family protein [Rhodothermia bacterium]
MDKRVALGHLLEEEKADAVLITGLPNVRWLTGFSGSNALVIATASSTTLVTDGRYDTQARQEAVVDHIHIADGQLLDHVFNQRLIGEKWRVIVQPERMTASTLETLRESLGAEKLLLREGLFQKAVARKDADEILAITKAQAISEQVFRHMVERIAPGVSETELAAELTYQHLRLGAERMAFEPIIASGPNSAMPHARPSDRKIQDSDVLLMDFGCVWSGYACDMTRTVVVGSASAKVEHVYHTVLDAQQAALESARAGLLSCELDGVARTVIESAGYGEWFTHSLGHGVGLEIHEWPRLSKRSRDRLPVSCVVTIEPGVYLPGEFGIRIEDMVILHSDGCTNLTGTPKDLLVL